MHEQPIRFTSLLPCILQQEAALLYSGLFIYSINRTATHFPCLLFQTRYGPNCFAKQASEDEAGSVFNVATIPLCSR
jgi:hypothetical protein